MKLFGLAFLAVLIHSTISAQAPVGPIYDAQRAFERAVAERGVKPAFAEFLADDAIIFRPEAVKAKEFLANGGGENAKGTVVRRVTYADASSNGLLGYTTGEWSFTPKSKSDRPRMGQYATVWSRGRGGVYKAILDIEITHEPFENLKRRKEMPKTEGKERNRKGWSVVDTTMNFFRASMGKKGLGEAYEMFASDDVILLREGLPPIVGRGKAEEELERYMAVEFPSKVSQFETADMAYSWNPCSYADSNEGMERGNCLHVWKFRDQKWRIVLGVFARVANEIKPVLQEGPRRRSN